MVYWSLNNLIVLLALILVFTNVTAHDGHHPLRGAAPTEAYMSDFGRGTAGHVLPQPTGFAIPGRPPIDSFHDQPSRLSGQGGGTGDSRFEPSMYQQHPTQFQQKHQPDVRGPNYQHHTPQAHPRNSHIEEPPHHAVDDQLYKFVSRPGTYILKNHPRSSRYGFDFNDPHSIMKLHVNPESGTATIYGAALCSDGQLYNLHFTYQGVEYHAHDGAIRALDDGSKTSDGQAVAENGEKIALFPATFPGQVMFSIFSERARGSNEVSVFGPISHNAGAVVIAGSEWFFVIGDQVQDSVHPDQTASNTARLLQQQQLKHEQEYIQYQKQLQLLKQEQRDEPGFGHHQYIRQQEQPPPNSLPHSPTQAQDKQDHDQRIQSDHHPQTNVPEPPNSGPAEQTENLTDERTRVHDEVKVDQSESEQDRQSHGKTLLKEDESSKEEEHETIDTVPTRHSPNPLLSLKITCSNPTGRSIRLGYENIGLEVLQFAAGPNNRLQLESVNGRGDRITYYSIPPGMVTKFQPGDHPTGTTRYYDYSKQLSPLIYLQMLREFDGEYITNDLSMTQAGAPSLIFLLVGLVLVREFRGKGSSADEVPTSIMSWRTIIIILVSISLVLIGGVLWRKRRGGRKLKNDNDLLINEAPDTPEHIRKQRQRRSPLRLKVFSGTPPGSPGITPRHQRVFDY